MNLRRLIGKLESGFHIVKGKVHASFSQAGEDQVIRYLLNDCLQLVGPTYLDIGTHHPVYGNNTYYFYLRGSKGVCVEPDPAYESLIKKYRPRDIFVTAGVGTENASDVPFYIFSKGYSGWNTFSKEEANSRKEQTGIDYKIISKNVIDINALLASHFSPWPNIISIDVEGLDYSILESLDFETYHPEIICVESITFSNSNEQEKVTSIADLLIAKGYFVFADTYVNTIFCRTDRFKSITR